MDFVARLKQYIEHRGLANSQFADMAGIPRPTLSQILTGRNKKISNEIIEKLHQAFPTLNVLWLLFGDGDMDLEGYSEFSEPQNSLFPEENFEQLADIDNTYDHTSRPEISAEKISEKIPAQFFINGAAENRSESAPAADRRVQSIMVFYSDNSFEVFEPVKK